MTMTMTDQDRIAAESLARSRESVTLADQGLYRCRFCKQTKPLAEGIVVSWGGAVIFALCPACHPGRPIVMKESCMSTGQRSVAVTFLREEDRPADLLVVGGMQQVNQFVPKETLKQFSSFDLSDDES